MMRDEWNMDGTENIPEEVLKAVQEASEGGELTCGKAHILAEDLHVPLLLVGKAANKLGLRLKGCQLGCF